MLLHSEKQKSPKNRFVTKYFKGGRGVLVIIPVASWHCFGRSGFCASVSHHIMAVVIRDRDIVKEKYVGRLFKDQDVFRSKHSDLNDLLRRESSQLYR